MDKHTVTRYVSSMINGLEPDDEVGLEGDEPFIIRIQRETEDVVYDSKKRRQWSKSNKRREDVVDLTLEEAGGLMASLADDISYCAALGERRVLMAQNDSN